MGNHNITKPQLTHEEKWLDSKCTVYWNMLLRLRNVTEEKQYTSDQSLDFILLTWTSCGYLKYEVSSKLATGYSP